MDSLYNQTVNVLLCLKQRLDLESISRELDMDLDKLESLLENLIEWDLVEFDTDTIIHSLTPEAENIIRYTQSDKEGNTSPLIRIK